MQWKICVAEKRLNTNILKVANKRLHDMAITVIVIDSWQEVTSDTSTMSHYDYTKEPAVCSHHKYTW